MIIPDEDEELTTLRVRVRELEAREVYLKSLDGLTLRTSIGALVTVGFVDRGGFYTHVLNVSASSDAIEVPLSRKDVERIVETLTAVLQAKEAP